MMDFSLLTSLGFVVLDVDRRGRIFVVNDQTPAWLDEVFGVNWNPLSKELIIDDYSVIGMFIAQELEDAESRDKGAVEQINFEESFGGNMVFTGQITSAVHGFRLRFILRRVDEFDEVSRGKVREIRKKALDATHFAEANEKNRSSGHFLDKGFAADSPDPSSKFLKLIVAEASDAMVILDHLGEFVCANSEALGLFPNLSSDREAEGSDFNVIAHILESATLSAALSNEYFKTLSEGFKGRLIGDWRFEKPHSHQRKITIQSVLDENGGVLGSVWIFSTTASPTEAPGPEIGKIRESIDESSLSLPS